MTWSPQRCNCIFWSGCLVGHTTSPPTQDHWTWNFGSSVCIGFDMAVGRREPREVQGWVCECWRVMGWCAVLCCRDWGVPTLPTRPYVVLELCHCATSVNSLEKLSSHIRGPLTYPLLCPQTMSHGFKLYKCDVHNILSLEEMSMEILLCFIWRIVRGWPENWLIFEVGEENVKDWVFGMEKVPASWVMVGHSPHWWRAGRERLRDLSQPPTTNYQTTGTSLTQSLTQRLGLRLLIEINIWLDYYDWHWLDPICIEVRWEDSASVTVWRNDENMRWWDWSDMKRTCPRSPSVLAGHREKYPQEVSIILDMFCCPGQLLISWIYIISSSDQAEHYLRSPETFTIFQSQSARSINKAEFESILGLWR